jgi:lipid-binding SYLF domain-containing protein
MTTLRTTTAALLALGLLHATAAPVHAASASEISAGSHAALRDLYAKNPTARAIGGKARAILVFPGIVKGGFIFGAEFGDGALIKGGRTNSYWRTTGVSWGFQAGAQKYGYALFLMSESAIKYLDETAGFELGAGPSLTVVDKGMATTMTTTTLRSDMYAFVFDQAGLMGGLSLRGTKVTRIHPQ